MTSFKINKEEQDFDYLSSKRMFIVPQTFRKTLPIYFQGYQQQDASEFCKVLLDQLEEEETLPEDETPKNESEDTEMQIDQQSKFMEAYS